MKMKFPEMDIERSLTECSPRRDMQHATPLQTNGILWMCKIVPFSLNVSVDRLPVRIGSRAPPQS